MGLTLNQETSLRVSEIVPPRMGRNEACHCGSGSKYKRCCWDRDEALRRQLRGAALPEWIDGSHSKLHQFEKYVCNFFGLPDLVASFADARRAPKIPTFDIVNSLFHTAVLRIPSINALEGDLKESDFQKLIGRQPTPEAKAFSADVVANVLDKLELHGIRKANDEVISKAERNKAFRRLLRCVALCGHRRLGTVFLLRSTLPELFSAQGQSEATHESSKKWNSITTTMWWPCCSGRSSMSCWGSNRCSTRKLAAIATPNMSVMKAN